MATRVNLMKMLQEARGLAELTNRRPHPGHPGPAVLPMRANWGKKPTRLRRILHVSIQDPPDIPAVVAIKHLERPQPPAAAAAD